MNFIVDLKGVKDKQELIKRFVDTLKLPDEPNWQWNWDAFNDYFRNLDTDSKVVRESDPVPQEVHLTIRNIWDVARYSKDEYCSLCEILVEATDQDNRVDKIKFTFEIQNEDK